MLDFKNITISDKIWIDELLKHSDFRGAEYCFTNLFIWDEVYHSKITRYKDFLLFTSGSGDTARYLFPPGKGDVKEAIELLEADAIERNVKFVLIGLSAQTKAQLETMCPGKYDFSAERNSFDYIYESEKMVSLAGKKLQSKRNHLARFRELPGWEYEDITEQNLQECINYSNTWCKLNGCGENLSLMLECCAVNKALAHYSELKLRGGLLRLDGKIVAYTVGEPLNSDTVIVHIEKADSEIRGSYPMINREFAERLSEGYVYINREDDAGDEGLRRAKSSYNPVFMQEKFSAIKK
ncbi:MAG: hypothetical protein ACD_77C00174G0007 [uncultured bacterium]|nr:MAG: hypothetical protein ACD_77C00174G0007 [uncultured bacterium]HBY02786.1 hypothetical protein [Rikenellaceae bacterium]